MTTTTVGAAGPDDGQAAGGDTAARYREMFAALWGGVPAASLRARWPRTRCGASTREVLDRISRGLGLPSYVLGRP